MSGKRVSYINAVSSAYALKSEGQENPEYDRALVELISDLYGYSPKTVAKSLALSMTYIYPHLKE